MNHGIVYAVLAGALVVGCPLFAIAAEAWPSLPSRNGQLSIPAQSWPQQPGPRRVRIGIVYPGGTLQGVNSKTGVMLTLHNWGGEDCAGTASPYVLAKRLNVVAVCVNYLQSGRKASIGDPQPYDYGYLQALDSLRALWFVCNGLQQKSLTFDDSRLFCTGGSGGGNVTQMAAKLAPRTFACIVDMCGMKKLSHDVAFNLPGGSSLNARWSRDPKSKNYLSVDHQELRFVGHPWHLATRKRLKSATKIVVVHGRDDRICPFQDAQEMVAGMKIAGLDVEPHFIGKQDIDKKVFTSSGHSLGNRTEIVFRVAGRYLRSGGRQTLRRAGPSDFTRRQEVKYRTTNGQFVISYKSGFPVGRFVPSPAPIHYREHQDLTYYLDSKRRRHTVKTPAHWLIRRKQLLSNLMQVMGPLPAVTSRVPLAVKQLGQVKLKGIERLKISYQSDNFDRVTAYLFRPGRIPTGKRVAGILCLHQTARRSGKDEPAGLAGKRNMHYGIELARRGYVVLVPDYPGMGEHQYDFAAHPEYLSGTMKAIWDNIRGTDYLQSLSFVDGSRLGVIGHSLGGHNAMFTAAFDQRLKAIVSSCGFTRFHKDDLPSWTGKTYMPRIATVFGNNADRVPFDFTEIVGSFAPRPFLAVAAIGDRDFDVSGVRDAIQSARSVYKLFGKTNHLQAHYPNTPHDFPLQARQRAYTFLDKHLQHTPKSGS